MEQRVINDCLAGVVALVLLKFLALLASVSLGSVEGSVGPSGGRRGARLPAERVTDSPSTPRGGRRGLLFVLFIAFVVSALLRDGFVRQSWADYPFAYGGLIVALIGIYYTASLIKHGRTG